MKTPMLSQFKEFVLLQFFRRIKMQTLITFMNKKRTKNKIKIDNYEYEYLFHSYNNFGITERSVEIPIIYHFLTTGKKKNSILEIGNVTNYYEDYFNGVFTNKTVVDKIEKSYNIITSDIADFNSDIKFDFVFSISTFEHMDSDLGRNPEYRPNTSNNCTIAADNILHCYNNLLDFGGLMVITAPLGYTEEWDLTFKSTFLETNFNNVKKRIFKRVSEEEWEELQSFDLNSEMKYGIPYPYANYISIIEILK